MAMMTLIRANKGIDDFGNKDWNDWENNIVITFLICSSGKHGFKRRIEFADRIERIDELAFKRQKWKHVIPLDGKYLVQVTFSAENRFNTNSNNKNSIMVDLKFNVFDHINTSRNKNDKNDNMVKDINHIKNKNKNKTKRKDCHKDNMDLVYNDKTSNINHNKNKTTNKNKNKNTNLDIISGHMDSSIFFQIKLKIKESKFIKHFLQLNQQQHPCWSLSIINMINMKFNK